MKIAMVWKNDYPWDVRVEKICQTLLSFGHEIHIIARNLRKEKTTEEENGIFIHRLNPIKHSLLNNIVSTPAFFNPVWSSSIYKICQEFKIGLIIVRDLPLVLNGVSIGKKVGVPVVFDMAECYPAMWKDGTYKSGFNLRKLIMKNPVLAKYLERIAIKKVDHILVVVEEAKSYLLQLGVDESKISIVSNTPDTKKIKRILGVTNPPRWKGKVVLLYQGYVNKLRGLEVAVRSLPDLAKEFPNILLVVAGDGNYLPRLKLLSKELKVENHVDFLGWVPFEEIHPMIFTSDICIVPHCATEHKNTTIPNKIFDYMACGKPVVVSHAKPLKRIVEEEECGMSFEAENVPSFVNVISQLLHNSSIRNIMAEKGRNAVQRKYNWERDSSVLKEVVENLTKIR